MRYLLIAIFLIGVTFADSKQMSPVVVSAKVDKARVTTGDLIIFTITLNREKGITLELPEFGDSIQGFRILDFGTEEDKEDDGRLTSSKWYQLQADLVGSYILPAIGIKFKNKEAQETTIKTSEIFIEVETVLKKAGDREKDIRNIKGLIKSPRSLTLLSIILIAVLFLVVVAIILLWIRGRRRKEIEIQLEPAHIVAIRELEKLSNSNIELKRFHYKLSEIIRIYFEGTFEHAVTDMTLFEIRGAIETIGNPNGDLKKQFLKILEETDIVKFTDTIFDDEQNSELLNLTKDFVEQTRPMEEVEESVI